MEGVATWQKDNWDRAKPWDFQGLENLGSQSYFTKELHLTRWQASKLGKFETHCPDSVECRATSVANRKCWAEKILSHVGWLVGAPIRRVAAEIDNNIRVPNSSKPGIKSATNVLVKRRYGQAILPISGAERQKPNILVWISSQMARPLSRMLQTPSS